MGERQPPWRSCVYVGESDADGDGSRDRIVELTYDERGDNTSYRLDGDADGTFDRETSWTFDEHGRYVGLTISRGGRPLTASRFVRDERGAVIREEGDHGADGTIDSVDTYVNDAEGRQLRWEHDSDNDGRLEWVETYAYDAAGARIRTETDEGNDGIVDRCTGTGCP